MVSNTSDAQLLKDKVSASLATSSAIDKLQLVEIKTTNLVKYFKDIDEPTIRRSNAYYSKYGADHLVENLAFLAGQILNTCEDSLRDKVRDGWLAYRSWNQEVR